MIQAILVLMIMGLILGLLLGLAAKLFHIDTDPLLDEITDLMPGTQCGQCGFPGCGPAAEAIVEGSASVTCCPPGGKPLAETLAKKLGVSVNLSEMSDEFLLAKINPEMCTGCTRCSKVCPTDAVIGANKQIHAVIMAACTGCKSCQQACPENCIEMVPESKALETWHWPKPEAA
ncbi:MAG: RnfABCDGE type electron transport complex subunit B [Pseudomonadales bacterium]|nr:RnfABCDGE type electron transport complex subunit B [Pseudomonadales bacterium]